MQKVGNILKGTYGLTTVIRDWFRGEHYASSGPALERGYQIVDSYLFQEERLRIVLFGMTSQNNLLFEGEIVI